MVLIFVSLAAALLLPVAAEAEPATITVDTTSDVSDLGGAQQVGDLPGPDGKVSLREAITAANNTVGPQVIGFAIPVSDAGFSGQWFTIQPTSPLPVLTDNGTRIDGSTQTLFTGDTNAAGPEIELNGGLAPSETGGLAISSSNNDINALVINGFGGSGIDIGGSGNVLTGSFIGVDPSGSSVVPNSGNGVGVGGIGNRIGGTTAGRRNVLSGNLFGVQIHSDGNVVEGNFIGTDATGTTALGNTFEGVLITSGATGNVIGGAHPGAGNVISANKSGVFIGSVGGANANTVEGNLIGTDVTGSVALGNSEDGIRIVSDLGFTANGNTIKANLIAHNAIHGVGLFSSSGNVIQGNRLEQNGQHGVSVGGGPAGTASRDNRIGGTGPNEGNVISENVESGVAIDFGSGNIVRGNRVQVNGVDGIRLTSAASRNSVSKNFLRANFEHDCHDDSVGSGTSGTANMWRRNDGETSQPSGLCVAGG